jgi:hypothetical protein
VLVVHPLIIHDAPLRRTKVLDPSPLSTPPGDAWPPLDPERYHRDMADREALWGWDLEEPYVAADDGAPGHDQQVSTNGRHDPITEPIAVVDPEDAYVDAATDDHRAEDRYSRPFMPGSPIGTLTFKAAPAPWYRTRKGLFAALGLVAVAVVTAIVPMVLRGSDAGTDESPVVTPTQPAPSTAPTRDSVPTLTGVPAPPPPPRPPPPPPPPVESNPPQPPRQYSPPRYSPPAEQDKPQIGVTRAPMSVAPQERTPPSTAVPDGKPRRGFF